MTEGGGADNITKMIITTLTNKGELAPHESRDQFMTFGAHGGYVLQGKRNCVTNKLQFFSCATHVRHALYSALNQP